MSLLFAVLPMVGVWCNWRVLLRLMAVRAAIVCHVLCCRWCPWLLFVAVCCSWCVLCVVLGLLLRVAVFCCCVLFNVVPCVVVVSC